MSVTYSTGPVENAAANASTSTWVKVLNLSETEDVAVDIKVYRLNGQKTEIASSTFTVFPLSSDFDVFELIDILQYEVQIKVSSSENVLITVWGKDANANILPAQRFVHNELTIISQSNQSAILGRTAPNTASRPTARRKRKKH